MTLSLSLSLSLSLPFSLFLTQHKYHKWMILFSHSLTVGTNNRISTRTSFTYSLSSPAAVVLIEINVNDIISWVKDSPFAVNIRVVTITYYTIVGSLNTIGKCSLYTILPMIEEMQEILGFKLWDTSQCHRILFLYSSFISLS